MCLHALLSAVFYQVAHHSGADDDHANPLLTSGQQSGPAWWRVVKTYLLRPLFFYASVSGCSCSSVMPLSLWPLHALLPPLLQTLLLVLAGCMLSFGNPLTCQLESSLPILSQLRV